MKNTPPPREANQFIVFHLMGTHFNYYNRYPSHFEKFSMEDLKEKGLDKMLYRGNTIINKTLKENALKRRAEYVNAVYYNDDIVAKLMEQFKNEEAIVFYLSDHGQNVYDDEATVAGHSSKENLSRSQVEIPFMIYASPLFQTKHPNIMHKIKNSLNQAFMTDDFMHAFFDLLNIECKEFKPELSLFNEQYQPKDRLTGEIVLNYDQVYIRQEVRYAPQNVLF